MLVLISFGLVLVATVLLVLGLLAGSGLALIYISIACSLAAGIVLVVATRINRPQVEPGLAGPAPLADSVVDQPVARQPAPAPTLASTRVAEEEQIQPPPAPEPVMLDERPVEPATLATPAVAAGADVSGDEGELDDDEFFPIADYDDLTVDEIMPLLPELYADELDVVEERERSSKSRASILGRIAELREQLAGAPPDTTAADLMAGVAASSSSGDESWDLPDDEWAAGDGEFPIAGYDDLSVGAIRDQLPDLTVSELQQVREREASASSRRTLLAAIDRELAGRHGAATGASRSTSAAKKTTAKKTTAKKTTAKKTAAKKTTAKKTTAKKTTAKKAPGSTKKR